jgi:hypothetical protein
VAQVSAFVTGGTQNRGQSERPLFSVLSPEKCAIAALKVLKLS